MPGFEFSDYRRLVVKVGSSLLIGDDGDRLVVHAELGEHLPEVVVSLGIVDGELGGLDRGVKGALGVLLAPQRPGFHHPGRADVRPLPQQ